MAYKKKGKKKFDLLSYYYDIGNRKIHKSVVWPEIPEE